MMKKKWLYVSHMISPRRHNVSLRTLGFMPSQMSQLSPHPKGLLLGHGLEHGPRHSDILQFLRQHDFAAGNRPSFSLSKYISYSTPKEAVKDEGFIK